MTKLLPAILLALLSACSQFAWPAVVERCVPAPQLVLSEVLAVLQRPEPPDAALKDLAVKHGADIVLCTVQELVRQMAQARSPAAQRGRAFLERTGTKMPGGE